MRCQPSVKSVYLLAATLVVAALDGVAAGLVFPPLMADPKQQNDGEHLRPCQYTGDFKQERNLEELDSPLLSTGRFLFSCDKGLLWETRAPIVDTRIYSTEKLNFRVRKNARVTQIKSIAESRTAKLLLNFLSGDTVALAEDFELVSDAGTPDRLLFLPRQTSVRKRLTQLIVQQLNDSLHITRQAPGKGDVVISITNISIYEEGELAACRKFSGQPPINCAVLMEPAKFVASKPDQD